MTSEKKLVGEGWKKQATYDEPRLSEMADMYKAIGLEVHLEPFMALENDDCTACLTANPDRFRTIYTRRKIERGLINDDGRVTKDEG